MDPLTIRIERARGYASPLLVAAAQSARGTPLVSVSESAERRFVVVGFGPSESNLASAPGFPVLVGNGLEWLAHPEAQTRSLRPGLASFSALTATVSGPGGVSVPLARVDGAAVGVLRTPGLYVAEGGGARSTFAMNAADPQRSNAARTSLEAGSNATSARGFSNAPGGWLRDCGVRPRARRMVDMQRRITVYVVVIWTAPEALWLLAAVPLVWLAHLVARTSFNPRQRRLQAAARSLILVALALALLARPFHERAASIESSTCDAVSHSVSSRAIEAPRGRSTSSTPASVRPPAHCRVRRVFGNSGRHRGIAATGAERPV